MLTDPNHVNVEDVLAFMALFEIPQLSEEVQKQEIPEMFVPCYSSQLYLRAIVPYIQRYLVALYPEVHEVHQEAGLATRLNGLLFVKVGDVCCLFVVCLLAFLSQNSFEVHPRLGGKVACAAVSRLLFVLFVVVFTFALLPTPSAATL